MAGCDVDDHIARYADMFWAITRWLPLVRLRWCASRFRRPSAPAWPARQRKRQKNTPWIKQDINIRREDLF